MLGLVLAAVLIAVTTARPEGGYSYNPPNSNYNLPNRHGVPGGTGGTFVTGTSNVGGFHSGGQGFSGIGSGFNTGGHAGISGTGSGFNTGGHAGISGTGSGFNTGGHAGISGTGSGFNTGGLGISGISSGVFTGGHGITGTVTTGSQITTGGQTTFGVNQGGLIHKHIYVHVAPPELELQQQQEIRATSAPQKHYKIIFIKTPTQSTSSVQQIQTQAQNQEKTLIYVLVKRPDDTQNIALTSSTSTKPSKPEVYFIRYKAAKETTGVTSGGAISGGTVSGGSISGGTVSGGSSGSTVSGGFISGGTVTGGFTSGGGGFTSGGPGNSEPNPRQAGGGGYSAGVQQSYGPPGQSGPY